MLGIFFGNGSQGTEFRNGVDQCHGLAEGSKVDLMEGVSDADGTGARMQAAGIRVGGTHEPTNGFKMTEVGEVGWFCVIVVCGGTMSLISTGAA